MAIPSSEQNEVPVSTVRSIGMTAVVLVLLLVYVLRVGTGRSKQQEPGDSGWPVTREFLLADMIPVEVKIYSPIADRESVFRHCEQEVERDVAIFSKYEPDSELSKLNHLARQETVTVSTELAEVLKCAFEMHRITRGAFDITVLPLIRKWQEAGKTGGLPDPDQLAQITREIGSDKVDFDAETRTVQFSSSAIALDVGGVSKGYIVDRMIGILQQAAVTKGLVNIGGDLRAFGGSAQQKFKIGVQDPRDTSALIGAVHFQDGAVATSGDYQQYVVIDGKRYSHIIDPRTAQPATWSPSVTILAADAMTADALATGVAVLGPEEGVAVIETLAKVECLVITVDKDDDLIVTMSSGMESLSRVNSAFPHLILISAL